MFIFPDRNKKAKDAAAPEESKEDQLLSTADMIQQVNERQTKAVPKGQLIGQEEEMKAEESGAAAANVRVVQPEYSGAGGVQS